VRARMDRRGEGEAHNWDKPPRGTRTGRVTRIEPCLGTRLRGRGPWG
jgi:hypothetical protein